MSNKSNQNSDNATFNALKNQVDDVKGVMTENIDRILQRGDRLDDLIDKTTDLELNAIQFNISSKKVKNKMWWKNKKMMLILILVVLIIIGIIATALALKFGGSSDPATTAAPPKPVTTRKTF